MVYRIRGRWIYEDVKGLRWKFTSEKQALEAEAEDAVSPEEFAEVVEEWQEWKEDGSIT